ncbi:MAG: phosphoglycolate phosphatase, partial [Candidatus Iainarchaeum archaeon]
MVKAVALDIDGTITRPDGTIPPESWGAIRELEENGIKVILVSGNAICVLLGLRH